MPGRLLNPGSLAIAVLIVLGSCGAGVTISSPSDPPPGGFDLSEPEIQAALGSPRLETPAWQRRAGDLNVVGQGTVPDPDEIDLIEAVARDVPNVIWDEVPIRDVVRVPQAPGNRTAHQQPVAYALGPDVYLLDRAFELSADGSSRYDLARAFVHELVHVAQFFSMTDDYVSAALSGEVGAVDPTIGSELVGDFAATTGWSKVGSGVDAGWFLPDGVEAATRYGRTSPGEDMAESVTLVAIGLPELVPQDRVRWVESWLGVTADSLARGRPWAPAGSEEVRSRSNLYDEESVAGLALERAHIEPIYFELPVGMPAAEELAQLITTELLSRGMSGSLRSLELGGLPRFGGAFAAPEGVTWWVELWDFRSRPSGTTGPDTPVLTYVAIW